MSTSTATHRFMPSAHAALVVEARARIQALRREAMPPFWSAQFAQLLRRGRSWSQRSWHRSVRKPSIVEV